jgi:transcriptional regulator with XRE-family HTH domain
MLIQFSHNRNMARRGKPKGVVPWYLPEWMAACDLKGRGAQAKMMELTGWSKATMSQLYNGGQDFSPKILAETAAALKCEPFELLMHPDAAMAIRRIRQDALRIVEDSTPPPAPEQPAQKKRKTG